MRNRRNSAFDLNRNVPQEINMANQQEIQEIRNALQLMQEQHQREIAVLQQQLAQPQQAGQDLGAQPMFQLTADQIINKFQRIRTFYGKQDYSLQEFISAVENVTVLCGNNVELLQHGLHTIVKEKIQGDARTCIQRLGDDLTWPQIKDELRAQFRPRKSYRKLLDETHNIKVGNLRELFNIIRSINFQLNEIYDYDDNKPSNYSPANNDKNLVDIIKGMLVGSYRINIRNNMTLNQVFNTFDDLGLLDEVDVIHYSFRKNHRDHHNHNVHRKEFKNKDIERKTQNFSPNNDRNTGPNNFRNFSGQFRRNENFRQERNFSNFNNHSGQFRQHNNQQRTFNNNNNSGQFRYRQNNNPHFNPNNDVVPMEIDNIQNPDVNFFAEPRKESYP